MSQKFDIGLNAKINEFARKYDITRNSSNDNEVFEDFSNYIIASSLLEDELDNVNLVSTNKSQGIDGIVLVINNRLVSEIDDLKKNGASEPIKIKIGFIQSTTQNSFDEQKFSAFTDEVVKFLSGEVEIEPFSNIYKNLLDEAGDYIDRIEDTPSVSLYFLSARTSHLIQSSKIDSEKRKITGRTELDNKCKIDKYHVLQKEEIKQEYDKIPKFHSVQMRFDTNVQLTYVDNIELSLLTTIKFKELKKLILTSDGNLKERLFVENVRNFIGTTNVNIDIKKTLEDSTKRQFFPFLNNGLSIICDKIEKHPVKPNEFTLTFPRIINGCQTTNMLYKHNKEFPNSIDDVEVVAKIISTSDNYLKKSIIHAANNQNSIDKDLQSLNDFHEKIETYFLGKEQSNFHLYFERLRGQHTQINPPYCKVNVQVLARVFISVFIQEPHNMKSNALGRIEQIQREGKIFKDPNRVSDYFFCAALYYWMNHLLVNNHIKFRSKTMDMHMLMVCNIILNKQGIVSTEDKILYLETEGNAQLLFYKAVQFVNNQEFLFERRGFYSGPKVTQLIDNLKKHLNGNI